MMKDTINVRRTLLKTIVQLVAMEKVCLFALVLYCGLGALALPSGPVSADAADDDEPDLLHMLDYFKGRSGMPMMVNFLKQMKMARTIGKNVIEICPICQEVFKSAGKTSVGLRIIDKVVEGKTPDLRDMYDLATKGPGSLTMAFQEARKKNRKFDSIFQLFLSSSSVVLSSTSTIEEALNGFTGKTFKLDPALVKGVYDGTAVTTVDNLAQVNLLQLITFWKKNADEFYKFTYDIGSPPFNFVNLLSITKQNDVSNLSKIKVLSGRLNDDKYTVVEGKQALLTDPDAVKVLEDQQKALLLVKQKSNDQVTAESVLMGMVLTIWKLTMSVVKDAEQDMLMSA